MSAGGPDNVAVVAKDVPRSARLARLLDAASGPLHPVARETLVAALEAGWADPARLHAEGRRAGALLDRSREVIAAGLGVRPPEVSFLPSGPTALARAVDGVLYAARRRGARTVASAVEHSAVLVPGRGRAARTADGEPIRRGAGRRPRAPSTSTRGARRGRPGHGGRGAAARERRGRDPPAARGGEGGCPAQRHTPRRRRHASLGRDDVPTDWDVLVGDARSWGGPPLGVLVVREGVRWQWPDARADVEAGRTDVAPWVPLALAAAEAWQQTAARARGRRT